jgi:hypothetical protein
MHFSLALSGYSLELLHTAAHELYLAGWLRSHDFPQGSRLFHGAKQRAAPTSTDKKSVPHLIIINKEG